MQPHTISREGSCNQMAASTPFKCIPCRECDPAAHAHVMCVFITLLKALQLLHAVLHPGEKYFHNSLLDYGKMAMFCF